MRIAVLGGSFNPIHTGHLYLADLVQASGFDRIVFVPANISPFKQHPSDIKTPSAEDRFDMVAASITADPRFAADNLEIRRGGVSYTVDTLKEVIDRYRPSGKPGLVLGDDAAADFFRWRRAEEIAGLADIIIARRTIPAGAARTDFPYPHKTLDNDVMNVSSALIRERIAGGSGAWRSLVPPEARRIIEDRGLYLAEAGEKPSGIQGLTARVETAARETLSAGRFLHSRNTALLARDIAVRYGLDGEAAYLAGIAHDMAKSTEPGLGHGKAAAVLLQERFGIHNGDILEAVEFHTTGKPGMGDVARAVFIADKIEYSRHGVQSRFREAAGRTAGEGFSAGDFSTLDDFFYAVLEEAVRRLEQAGIEPAEETCGLLQTKSGS